MRFLWYPRSRYEFRLRLITLTSTPGPRPLLFWISLKPHPIIVKDHHFEVNFAASCSFFFHGLCVKPVIYFPLPLKPRFHMSRKSQTIGHFVIFRPSQTFPTQGDNQRHLPRRVFISRECLGRSGNNKIPDGLGFSRHMKTRFDEAGDARRATRMHDVISACINLDVCRYDA